MLRTALTPRWLALLGVVLVLASGMAWLGSWQLDRARERGSDAVRERQQAEPVALLGVLKARQSFTGNLTDTPVEARGTWDGEHQLLVPDRVLNGVEGLWVLTPLVLEDGSAVAVVRGWVPGADDPAGGAPPRARSLVTVRGVLQPGQPPADREPGQEDTLPADQIASVSPADLVQRWPYPLLTGYVVATAVEPQAAPSLTPVPTLDENAGGLALRNLSYALQWWVFAGFGLFIWWRLVRDDHRGEPAPAPRERGPEPLGEEGDTASAVPGARR